MKPGISIAIDGPAGSGKSTIAKIVAVKFSYLYIDTGAMYRAIALKALKSRINIADETKLVGLAEDIDIRLHSEIGKHSPLLVFMDGEDVSEAIRSLEVTNLVSMVAAVAGVRTALVKLQQKMAQSGGVVMDGRDIGTVVLPHAELKVFLTASVDERSKRRWLELKGNGLEMDLQELREQIKRRDYIDSNRAINPLRQADDAVFLDTSDLSIEQVAAAIIGLAVKRGAALP